MRKSVVVHPFLFAVFPILFLYSHNIERTSITDFVAPAVISALSASSLWFLLSLAFKSKQKAGLLVSLSVLLFFSYGHLCDAVGDLAFSIRGTIIGADELLVFVCSLLVFLGAYFLAKSTRNFSVLTKALNVAAVFLLCISLIGIGSHALRTGLARHQHGWPGDTMEASVDWDKPDRFPDIYYIILDGYARADILEELYRYDNGEFLDYLKRRGFCVAHKSKSNYCQTALSLASSLNLQYIQELINRIHDDSRNTSLLRNLIRESGIARFLRQHGYTFVAFSSGYSFTEMKSADIYMSPSQALSESQNLLINRTPLRPLLTKLPLKSQYDLHRDRLLYVFDELPRVSKTDSPVFVFAHIMAPHPPFVFGEDGEPIRCDGEFSYHDGSHYTRDTGRDEYKRNYIRQLVFINKKTKEAIDRILAAAPEPPVIILQSDHGPGSMLEWDDPKRTNLEERMSILNAYHLPDDGHELLYDEITPVNTFRIICNHYFGTSYDLLRDESYFSNHQHPYRFINVTDQTTCRIHPECSTLAVGAPPPRTTPARSKPTPREDHKTQ
ncbi:MAG: sulfatase-like hydrolase/transferase [Candidatus Zixiibacteriota bacterium]